MSYTGRILVVLLVTYAGAGEGQHVINSIQDFAVKAQQEQSLNSIHQNFFSQNFSFPSASASQVIPASIAGPTSGNSNDSSSIVGAQASLNGFVDCRRRCDGRPRTCYFRLHVERYSVLGGACRNCSFGNRNDCTREQCVTANGFYRSFISVNRQLPAPAIHVCRGDRIIADVENAMPDEATTVHWHGLRQKGSQYYDGVPYITQCPIPPGSTFRYDFWADEAGTFFYHSHVGVQKLDGFSGPFIVREENDYQSNLYDEDLPEHHIFINDWTNMPGEQYIPGFHTPTIGQGPDAILINGRGMHWAGNQSLPITEFVVQRGRRYRFRLIGGTCMTCGFAIRIQGHKMLAISADGNLKFEPKVVDSVQLNSADRFDVVVAADQPSGVYYIYAESSFGFCNIRQVAVLRYSDSTASVILPPPPLNNLGVVLNSYNSSCDGTNSNQICVSQLRGDTDAPSIVDSEYAFLFIALSEYIYNDNDLFAPGTYQYYDEPVMNRRVLYLANNISFAFPSSPMISQFEDIPQNAFCDKQCYNDTRQKPCRCTNYYPLPYNTVINVLVYDTGDVEGFAHPYHLHGYNFYILGAGRFPTTDPVERQQIVNQLMNDLNNDDVDLRNKPQRDTISVPPQGWVMTRFFSDNPGPWLLHCHFAFHLEAGMDAVFQIGDYSELPPVPQNFPQCGNYLPQEEDFF